MPPPFGREGVGTAPPRARARRCFALFTHTHTCTSPHTSGQRHLLPWRLGCGRHLAGVARWFFFASALARPLPPRLRRLLPPHKKQPIIYTERHPRHTKARQDTGSAAVFSSSPSDDAPSLFFPACERLSPDASPPPEPKKWKPAFSAFFDFYSELLGEPPLACARLRPPFFRQSV